MGAVIEGVGIANSFLLVGVALMIPIVATAWATRRNPDAYS
ncbi:MAG: hypothetical protein ACK4NA_08230 [Alphaproteobacteria bacterium]